MSKKYREKLSVILNSSHPRLSITHTLEYKNFFGSVVGSVDDNIFVSCGKFGLALKLPEQTLQMLLNEKGAKLLQYFPKGHIKKNYAIIPEELIEDKELVQQSIEFVKS